MVSELLKKAEILTEHDPSGKAVTFNNFACFSRQQGRLHASLSYLQKALAIEQKLPHVDTPADTHLNLCAVLSQLGRHREALEHSQQALMLLQEELFADGASARAAQKPDRIAVLAICYHNIGVECEFLKHYQASLQAYTKGVEIASVYLGATHGITQTLERSQAAARQAIDKAATAKRNSSRFAAGAIAAAGAAKKGAAGGAGSPASPRGAAGGAGRAGAGGRSGSVGRAPLRGMNNGGNKGGGAGGGAGGRVPMGMGMDATGGAGYGADGGAGAMGDPYGGAGGAVEMDAASAALLQQQMAMQLQMQNMAFQQGYQQYPMSAMPMMGGPGGDGGVVDDGGAAMAAMQQQMQQMQFYQQQGGDAGGLPPVAEETGPYAEGSGVAGGGGGGMS
jgi:tetratricopeptide (TPR) repeat protein